MGVEVYYYTGDSGSSINRTFYNGEMVSEKVLAFPIVPSGLYASLGEMHELGHYDNEKVLTWLKSIPDYGRNNRTLRLFYSHPYDLDVYEETFFEFLDYLDEEEQKGSVAVMTMTDAARFLQKMLKTKYSFKNDTGLTVALSNPDGLEDITIAVPKKGLSVEKSPYLKLEEDNNYYYLTVKIMIRKNWKYILLVCSVFVLSGLNVAFAYDNSNHPVRIIALRYRTMPYEVFITPYEVGLYALDDLDNTDHRKDVKAFLEWYLKRINNNDKNGMSGTIYDVILYGDKEKVLPQYDSIDGYSGLFLVLLNKYCEQTGDISLIKKYWQQIEDMAYTISYLSASGWTNYCYARLPGEIFDG